MALVDAVASGERLASLVAVRDKLAAELESADARSAAGLARELRATLAEIESLMPTKEGSRFDELAARRQGRIAGTEDQQRSAGKRGGRRGVSRTR